MVEINLFEDDESQPAKHDKSGDSPSRGDDDLAGDSVKSDDFSFDEELTEPSLDPLDPDIEPEFVPDEPKGSKTRKSRHGGGSRQVSPLIWALLGLAAVAAAGILLYPKFFAPKAKTTVRKGPGPVVKIPVRPPVDTTRNAAGQTGTTPPPAVTTASGPTVKYAETAKAVIENLGKDSRFVALLLKGDQYFVEYAAGARGGQDEMGKRIQALLGADSYKASPEDRHKVSGSDRYFGVISGRIPIAKSAAPAAPAGSKTDAEAFKARLNALVTEKGLTNTKIQKVSEVTLNGKLQTPIRLRTEGPRQNALAFLESLKALPANGEMCKLLVAPTDISDLAGAKLKLVLDFAVE
ncbi:MAG: hypothetical protein QUS35_00620 [bacterium]|nr:hypothetical protein [bacterium]